MRRLARYLKPYIWPIIACVLLLFGQAMCDLNLPNLMSNIVNVGIQQGGIEDRAPQAISENGYTLIKTFMTAEEQDRMDGAYQKIDAGSAEAEDYRSAYPALASTDIYVLRAESPEQVQQLADAYEKSVMTFSNVMRGANEQGDVELSADKMSLHDLDFTELYRALPMLEQLPEESVQQARKLAEASQSAMGGQMGVAMTREFYRELGVDVNQIQSNYILKTGLFMLLLTLAGAVATICVGLLAARVAAGTAKNLRRDVFRKVESFSNDEFDQFSTASLITRTTNDVTQVQMLLILGLRMICLAPIMGIGGILMALNKSVSMSWIIALGVLILIGIVVVVFSIVTPKFKIVQKLVDKLNLVTRENLSGMMVIRAFGTQKFEEERFEKANKDLTSTNLFVNRVMVAMMPAMMFMMNVVSLLIVWVGGHQIEQSMMQVGDMMAFMQYAMQVIMSFLMISMMFIMVPRAAVSGGRIAEVLETEPTVRDAEQPVRLKGRAKGKIEFRDVSFRYSNAEDDVLQDISFTALPGQTTAFIGSTGSGKSTLINLIPRFYDVTSGKILLDGVDVRKIPQHELRENIGYVPQKGILFSGDIASNLRYGSPDATDREIERSAEVAQAAEFIQNMPDGLHTDISQGGTNVSGGQKQRLSIGRALTKRAPVYIFDDSFSALDFKTDAALRRALKKDTGDSTVLIVAQRVSTIMDAEQIIVLDEGKIVGIGTHKELMRTCGTYQEIARSQLSEEELA
ncbi:ABC transporter ATP-binding protein [Clostridium sp. D33t1_170424_F3]|uniref:ABC transporter ATP-binding protein n=1 Tax=Clostridium sp. D33t1_170424_F3 TaxID=2787099 RepID=UPI0018AC0E9C|nr:ABC transporter ATP-binding protein [Clostridium sp. D33t1_170424_F3]